MITMWMPLTISNLIEFFIIFFFLKHGRHGWKRLCMQSGQRRNHCEGRWEWFRCWSTVRTRSPSGMPNLIYGSRIYTPSENFTTECPWHGSLGILWATTCGAAGQSWESGGGRQDLSEKPLGHGAGFTRWTWYVRPTTTHFRWIPVRAHTHIHTRSHTHGHTHTLRGLFNATAAAYSACWLLMEAVVAVAVPTVAGCCWFRWRWWWWW